MKSILDPTFRYVPATETDLRKTFERVRREQGMAQPGAQTRFERQTIAVIDNRNPRWRLV